MDEEIGDNQLDAELIQKYDALDDECQDRLLQLQMKYMSDCREVREQQKRNLKMAIAEGLPKDGYPLRLKLRRAESAHKRRIDNIMSNEDPDTIESFEAIEAALGAFADTPLGGAAIKAAKPEGEAPKRARKRKGDHVASSSTSLDDLGADPDEQQAALNKDRLEGGISKLKH